MPLLVEYLVKLSIGLGVVYLFYQLFLRRLTFYGINRWYLMGYSLLSFLFPLMSIEWLLHSKSDTINPILQWVPTVARYSSDIEQVTICPEPIWFTNLDKWQWLLIIVATGSLLLLIRFLIRLASFLRLRKSAVLISSDETRIYQVNRDIIPFSFGNAIYVNQQLHSQQELERIILHEFVHVREKHSIDILLSEIICLLNWYNPFAWLLRQAIRQNLEFIADDAVLRSGLDRKQYQYLLLKVIGNHHYSIANQFNFSSLKKRIVMMNKLKTSPAQLLRLLLLLPAIGILLLAFRDTSRKPAPMVKKDRVQLAGLVLNAQTMQPVPFAKIEGKDLRISITADKNGYYRLEIPFEDRPLQFHLDISKPGFLPLSQQENWGNFANEYVFSSFGKTIEFFGLTPEGSKAEGFGSIAGNAKEESGLRYESVLKQLADFKTRQASYDSNKVSMDNASHISEQDPQQTSNEKDFLQRHPKIERLSWGTVLAVSNNDPRLDALQFAKSGDIFMTIHFKNGKWDMYNVKNTADRARFKKNYGEEPPQAPPTPDGC